MTCQRCKEAYADGKPNDFGSEPECAFKTDVFDSSNWQCQTMNELRELVGEDCKIWNEDQWVGVLRVWAPENDKERAELAALGGWDFVILGWYKHRGRTKAAHMMRESTMAPLTLVMAERVLEKK